MEGLSSDEDDQILKDIMFQNRGDSYIKPHLGRAKSFLSKFSQEEIPTELCKNILKKSKSKGAQLDSKSFIQSHGNSPNRKSPTKLKGRLGRRIRAAASKVDTLRKSTAFSGNLKKNYLVPQGNSQANSPVGSDIEVSEELPEERRARALRFDNPLAKSTCMQDELFQDLHNLREKLEVQNKLLSAEEDEYSSACNKILRKIKEDNYHFKTMKESQLKTGVHTNLSKVMSEMEVDFVKKYFHHCSQDSAVLEMIDKILRELKFFRRMRRSNRKHIILSSTLMNSSPGEYVIKQGEIGEHMYIIIRG